MSAAGPRDSALNKALWAAKDHATRAFALARLQDHREALRSSIDGILYPAAPFPGARHSYLSSFGCAAWTESGLQAVKFWAPRGVVELGAGAGQWAAALRVRGVDVLAYDDMSSLPDPARDRAKFAPASSNAATASTSSWWSGKTSPTREPPPFPTANPQVERGNEEVLLRSGVYRRALLLVYPPPGPMAASCLEKYSGDTVIFVGEGRGGVNADEAFFDALDEGNSKRWCLVHTEALLPFPGGCERMYVFQQRKFPFALQTPFTNSDDSGKYRGDLK